MRFEDEHYVRIYRRDTTTWLMLNWQARCILPLIFRKLDRAGLLDLGEDGWDALAAHIQVPVEVVEEGMKSILKRGTLVVRDDGLLVAPRFIEAQEAKQSDKARQKASRERARDLAAAVARGVTVRDGAVTDRDDPSSASAVRPPSPPTAAGSTQGPSSHPAPSQDITTRDPGIALPAAAEHVVTIRDDSVTRGHAPSQAVTLSCAVPSREEEPPRPPVGREPETTLATSGARSAYSRMEEPFWREAYTAAVLATLGSTWGFPDKQISGLRKAIEAHCRDRAAVDGWLRLRVADFVRATRAKPGVWSSFGPDGFLRWLNAGAPREADRASPTGARPERRTPPLEELKPPSIPTERRVMPPRRQASPSAPGAPSEARSPPSSPVDTPGSHAPEGSS